MIFDRCRQLVLRREPIGEWFRLSWYDDGSCRLSTKFPRVLRRIETRVRNPWRTVLDDTPEECRRIAAVFEELYDLTACLCQHPDYQQKAQS